uniref:S8 family serine peptidase n=1 Tax=Corynebacterium senegalense TaxID=2080750 RepID=UPI0015F2928B
VPAPPPWAAELRRFATGAGVRVAVVDTGVSPSPELGRLVGGADLVAPDAPDPLFDCDGHGTVVAGIIAAATTGIAPGAEILSVRQTSAHYRNRREGDAVEASGSLRSLTEAIHAALDEHARVINVSVVSCVDRRDAAAVDASALDDALGRAEAEGAVVVAAAGNVSDTCPQGAHVFPSHSPTVLAVGARDGSHTVAGFSVAPPAGAPLLTAPGTVDTGLSWAGGGFARGSAPDRDTVTPFTGTSFATPVVSATAALLLERDPQLSAAEVRRRIADAAQPAGGAVDPLAVVTHVPDAAERSVEPLRLAPASRRVSPALQRAALVAGALSAALALAGAAAVVRREWRRGRQ